jgi:hypothetical protein
MRLFNHPIFRQLGRHPGLRKFLCPAMLALAGGCAELHCCNDVVVVPIAKGERRFIEVVTVPAAGTPPQAVGPAAQAVGPAAQAVDAMTLPAKEAPPAAHLDFSLSDPNVPGQMLPPIRSEEPTAQPKPAQLGVPGAQTKDVLPQLPKSEQKSLPPQQDSPPPEIDAAQPIERLSFSQSETTKLVSINLETVLRLADAQNGQNAVAREKLREAFAHQELAAKSWLPDIASTTEARQRVLEQRAEVGKLSAETLLEASTTYVDLLAARATLAIALQTEAKLQGVLKQATVLAKTNTSADLEILRIQAELDSQAMHVRQAREAALTATAKLIYLLGLHPESELTIMDRQLAAFTLVNADAPPEELFAKAQQNGPAFLEMEDLAHCVEAVTATTGFGSNTALLSARTPRERVAKAKIEQAQAAFQDLRAKLIMTVQAMREAALSSRDQMGIGLNQLKHANDCYERTKTRFQRAASAADRSTNELLQTIRAVDAASLVYLTAIRDHDKAQLGLAILTGALVVPGDR